MDTTFVEIIEIPNYSSSLGKYPPPGTFWLDLTRE
jgi:hypothetical protein